jgi:GNAT superfamily N-acetyltransferase
MGGAALSALDCNYLDASRIFMAFSRRGEYLERRGVAIASCGHPVETLNMGFLKPPHEDLAATAAGVRSYFEERGLPFRLAYRDDQRESMRELEAAGWLRKSEPVPGMTLAMPASVPRSPAALEIQPVRTTPELVAFRETAFQGFGYPPSAARHFIDERLLGLPGVRLYAGLLDGACVATSMLVATGAVGGIYWVATLEEQRGRGYGEALTWAAVEGGREQGCTVASLQASQMGRPVYARMGFAHVLDYEYLHPPER